MLQMTKCCCLHNTQYIKLPCIASKDKTQRFLNNLQALYLWDKCLICTSVLVLSVQASQDYISIWTILWCAISLFYSHSPLHDVSLPSFHPSSTLSSSTCQVWPGLLGKWQTFQCYSGAVVEMNRRTIAKYQWKAPTQTCRHPYIFSNV